VAGALAHAAEDVFRERLAEVPLDMVTGLFVRLVRLGDTGGRMRRVARRTEFTETTWPLVQRLAGGALPAEAHGVEEQGGYARLVSIAGEPGEETVEIAHEALVTQWPRYQAWLEGAAPDKRVFDRLIERAGEWQQANEGKAEFLAFGHDRETYSDLSRRRGSWLSGIEHAFVAESLAAETQRQEAERRQRAEIESAGNRIFISYRRDDSLHAAGRVHDSLSRTLGREVLFMDVDSIPLGANFAKILSDEVAKSSVLLAIIGPRWLDARNSDGSRRLDDSNDLVRIEIAAALARNIPVIPILLDGTPMPKSSQLPVNLQELSARNGLNVNHTSFRMDMSRLKKSLKVYFGNR
jgi:hypothetical protein